MDIVDLKHPILELDGVDVSEHVVDAFAVVGGTLRPIDAGYMGTVEVGVDYAAEEDQTVISRYCDLAYPVNCVLYFGEEGPEQFVMVQW